MNMPQPPQAPVIKFRDDLAGFMHVRLADAVQGIPLPPTPKWRHGVFDREFFRKKGFSVSIFAPRVEDLQTPHEEDEIYLIASGRGQLEVGGETISYGPGDMIYVPAKMPHRFTGHLGELIAWVIFLPA